MRRVLYIALAVILCSFYALAQDYPKAEVYGGFSLLHLDTEGAKVPAGAPAGTSIKNWYPGWEAAGQYNLTKMLGVKADFSGEYGKPVSVPGVTVPSLRFYTFLAGPVITFRGDRFSPFVHAGFGVNHLSLTSYPGGLKFEGVTVPNTGYSENAFAMAYGGGLDVKLTHHFAWRLGQFDYVYTKHCLATNGTCNLGVDSAPAAHQNNFRFSTGIVIH